MCGEQARVRVKRYPLLPRADVMSLLILLSIPAIAGIVLMGIALTNQVLYPRLKPVACRVIEFKVRFVWRPSRRAA